MIRDKNGLFKVVMANCWLGDVSVLEAMAYAMRYRLKFSTDLSCHSVEVEYDSLVLIAMLNSGSSVFSYVRVLFEEILGLGSVLDVISFSSKFGKSNGVTHKLAQLGVGLDSKTR